MSAAAKMWKDNKVIIVMGGILTLGHFVWKELQNNTAFVPAGSEKDYPWIEIAKHVKAAQNAQQEGGSGPAAPPQEK